jgi:hypothetical protein
VALAGGGNRIRLGPAVNAAPLPATTDGLLGAGTADNAAHSWRVFVRDGRVHVAPTTPALDDYSDTWAVGDLLYLGASAETVVAYARAGRAVRTFHTVADRTPPDAHADPEAFGIGGIGRAGERMYAVQQGSGGVQVLDLESRAVTVVPGDNLVMSTAGGPGGDVYVLTGRDYSHVLHLVRVAPGGAVSTVTVPDLPLDEANALRVLTTSTHGTYVFRHGRRGGRPAGALWHLVGDRLVAVPGVTGDLGHVATVGDGDRLWIYGSVGHNRVAEVDLDTGRVDCDVAALRGPPGSRVVAVMSV